MALWGEPGAMIDKCKHLPVMTYICNNNYKLCFIGFTNLFILAIGILVKSHISTPLVCTAPLVYVLP